MKATLTGKHISVIVSAWVLSILLIAGFSTGTIQNLGRHGTTHLRENVYVVIEDNAGAREYCVGNTITNIGERFLRNVHSNNNESAVLIKSISLGNDTDTTDVTNTKLDTEATTVGFTRANGTISYWVSGGDYSFNITKKFTATGNIAINAAGLHWSLTSDSDENLYAAGSLGGTQSFQNNWNITVVWVLTFNAN